MDKHDGGDPLALRVDDPWRDAGAAGLWLPGQTVPAAPPEERAPAAAGTTGDRGAIYEEVQLSAAFREVRQRYRGFAFPMAAAFVTWYLLYVVMATTAPGLMGRRVAGQVNVAMVAGLAQFATTFLLTWAYARHARLRRDQAALDLRWTLATRTGQERVR
ncbi:DUF485 domain-containing protein [Streptomyces sp. PRB2-1]|uniref:DUF485 domain-containing protein n=2 Tax=Actinacidiphila epipremni TaxID=2053013 RepID=A0ABX0ZUH4_9ACTN|nr:DUF485 domain-containing protein [Actinacidiphila epipremni]